MNISFISFGLIPTFNFFIDCFSSQKLFEQRDVSNGQLLKVVLFACPSIKSSNGTDRGTEFSRVFKTHTAAVSWLAVL